MVRLLGYSGLRSEYAPWREYYMARNITYTTWWLFPSCRAKQFALRRLARRAGGLLLFASNKLACLKRMAQGFWDGRRARLGIRFLPN